jgi:hypothetical protein
MFFRFGAALCLIVLVALSGTALEKENLQLKRALTQQQYRLDVLLDSHVRMRLQAQTLGTPERLLGPLERGELPLERPTKPLRTDQRRAPLVNWSQISAADQRNKTR